MDQSSKSTKTDSKSREQSCSDSDIDYFEVSMIDEKDYKVNTPLVEDSNHVPGNLILKSRSAVEQINKQQNEQIKLNNK